MVEHPGPDFFLAAWWGLDVVLAWLVSDDTKWVRVQRGAVHFLAFAMFFGATVLAAKAGIVAHLLGIVMVLAVAACSLIRLITRENDPKSLFSVVYVETFALLNRFVVWHKLPTWLAVINLGALRDVLRAKNLHNTSDIPVTNRSRAAADGAARSALSLRARGGRAVQRPRQAEMGNASLGGPDFTLSNPGARFGRNIPLSEVDPDRDGRIAIRARGWSATACSPAAPRATAPTSSYPRRASISWPGPGSSSRPTTGSITAIPVRWRTIRSTCR